MKSQTPFYQNFLFVIFIMPEDKKRKVKTSKESMTSTAMTDKNNPSLGPPLSKGREKGKYLSRMFDMTF